MASESPKTNTFRKKSENGKKAPSEPKKPLFTFGKIDTRQLSMTFGIILISISIFLFIAFVSYLLNGPQDQSLVMNNPDQEIRDSARESKNWVGYLGAQAANWMIYRWFGVAAFLFPPFLFLLGFKWTFRFSLISLTRYSVFALFFTAWLGLLTGYAVILVEGYSYWSFLSGGLGYELAKLSHDFLGMGTFILIAGAFLIFVVLFFGIQQLNWFSPKEKIEEDLSLESKEKGISPNPFASQDLEEEMEPEEEDILDDGSEWEVKTGPIDLVSEENVKPSPVTNSPELSFTFPEEELEEDIFDVPQVNLLEEGDASLPLKEGNFTVQKAPELEKTAEEVENLDPYDPTLDLRDFQFPPLDLLKMHGSEKIMVDTEELEAHHYAVARYAAKTAAY